MILNFFTATKVDNRLLTKKSAVASRYIRTWFCIDVISSFPTEILSGVPVSSNELAVNKLLRLLRFFKLLRVFRIARLVRRLKEIVNVRHNICTYIYVYSYVML